MARPDKFITELPPGRTQKIFPAIKVLTIEGQKPGPTLVVLGAIHGDEYEGILAIQDIFTRLQPKDISGKLLLVPVCNPLAYQSYTRLTPQDGKNLARVFPAN